MTGFHPKADSAHKAQGTERNGDLRFLSGGGEVGHTLRSGNCLPASMQTPEAWPDSVKTLVGIMFSANQPMFVGRGAAPDL
jgi:hypothetical protein